MTASPPEPQPTFTLVELIVGCAMFVAGGNVLGGIVGSLFARGWNPGARWGGLTGFGLFMLLVIRTIWIAVNALEAARIRSAREETEGGPSRP
ncbi:MAG: hypothetical protein SFX72_18835 [Isosphaeraceae bacterium]|nr:hypothetical protein [Isosphaeraceae bacterium]